MAGEDRQSIGNRKRILADSAGAKHRFGFEQQGQANGVGRSTITKAPKTSDLWFVEFNQTSGDKGVKALDISALARAVSGISVVTSTIPVDQYGKRLYVPTRVDFPEVSITMYDTVDGTMFDMAASMYERFFSNNSLAPVDGMQELLLSEHHRMYGRKIPDKSTGEYYHQSFESIKVNHFFGNLDSSQENEGFVQQIQLINPLVTNITFSPSDYSSSEPRTIEITVQPENVVFYPKDDNVQFPSWMSLGLDYILDELSPITTKTKGMNKEEELFDKLLKEMQNTSNFPDADGVELQNDMDEVRKLNELRKLYNKTQELSGDTEAAKALLQELRNDIGTIKASNLMYAEEGQQNRERTDNNVQGLSIDLRETMAGTRPSAQETGNSYKSTILNPNVPDFAGLGSVDGGSQTYSPANFGSAVTNELVSAFFNGRSVNFSNITRDIGQGILGNTGIGNLSSLGKTSQSRFGVAGDLIRDGITNGLRQTNTNGISTTTTTAFPSESNQTSNSIKSSNTTPDKTLQQNKIKLLNQQRSPR